MIVIKKSGSRYVMLGVVLNSNWNIYSGLVLSVCPYNEGKVYYYGGELKQILDKYKWM